MNPANIIEEWKEKNGTIAVDDGRVTVQGTEIIQITFSKHSPPLHDILFYRIVVYPPSQGIYFYYYHHGYPNSCFDDSTFLQGMNTLSFEQFSDVMRKRHPEFFEWVIWNLL